MIYCLPDGDEVLLVTIYSKTEQSDIETDQIRKIIEDNERR